MSACIVHMRRCGCCPVCGWGSSMAAGSAWPGRFPLQPQKGSACLFRELLACHVCFALDRFSIGLVMGGPHRPVLFVKPCNCTLAPAHTLSLEAVVWNASGQQSLPHWLQSYRKPLCRWHGSVTPCKQVGSALSGNSSLLDHTRCHTRRQRTSTHKFHTQDRGCQLTMFAQICSGSLPQRGG